MSIDVALESPTSTLSVDRTLSDWTTLRLHLDAERAVKAAARRREIGPTTAPTAAELRLLLAKYNDWLGTLYVQNHGALANWVRQQKANVLRQLANLEAGAR